MDSTSISHKVKKSMRLRGQNLVFRSCVYMSGRVSLEVSYQLGRVTLLGGPAFCLLKPHKRLRFGVTSGKDFLGSHQVS